MDLTEFKPTILFLGKFIGIYVVGNLLYGAYVQFYDPVPDPVTEVVTRQSAKLLEIMGWRTTVINDPNEPTTRLIYERKNILRVYEGCNGINIGIIFIAFIIAFGPITIRSFWFSLAGAAVIHTANLLRIMLLFFVTIELPRYVYFMHKYFFTAIIYAVVFVMWFVWLRYFNRQHS